MTEPYQLNSFRVKKQHFYSTLSKWLRLSTYHPKPLLILFRCDFQVCNDLIRWMLTSLSASSYGQKWLIHIKYSFAIKILCFFYQLTDYSALHLNDPSEVHTVWCTDLALTALALIFLLRFGSNVTNMYYIIHVYINVMFTSIAVHESIAVGGKTLKN